MTPRAKLDVKKEVLDALHRKGCTVEERDGITYVTAPNGDKWDFTVPQQSKTAPLQG
jgi:hypothetical protein